MCGWGGGYPDSVGSFLNLSETKYHHFERKERSDDLPFFCLLCDEYVSEDSVPTVNVDSI